jgi:hypothetical protein
MAKQHKLTIADAHLQTILRAIAKESWQVANPIIQSISNQLQQAEEREAAAIAEGMAPCAGSDGELVNPTPCGNGHDKKAPLI